ncbi:MAG: cupin domain-containing protein [Chloroflexota bacterium]
MSAITVTALKDVEAIPLPNGSWSRMLVTDKSSTGNRSSLGYSVFTPKTELPPVAHETEEVAYVVAGAGELRLDDEIVQFKRGDALLIPPGVWHAVVNTGDEDVVMVFGFPHPDYPPTERR